MKKKQSDASFLIGLVLGIAIGAAVSLVLTPHSGEENRARLKGAAGDAKDSLQSTLQSKAGEAKDALQSKATAAKDNLQSKAEDAKARVLGASEGASAGAAEGAAE